MIDECDIGRGVHVSLGANLDGEVKVGDKTLIGIQSCIFQAVTISTDKLIKLKHDG